MDSQLLPLFPLSLVLLPAMQLPLHIFEERYRELMADIMAENSEFGVVFAKDGGIVNIGCTAKVDQVLRRYPDGRLDLMAIGQRRFRINALDQEKSYLRAEVEYFNDEDVTDVPSELRQKAVAAYQTLAALEKDPERPEPKFELARISFQLAQLLEDFEKRQTVLTLRSEVERLEYLVRVVPEYIVQREQIALARRLAPMNGHAKAAL
ncbi:MAG TPA: LON peptidase substrate-binding domain-containing protein [Bryobacteraceae bacterium]|nr:LON peptidase substrate-binding domain-containing protein [Bryobacteraceae bacterium]